MTEPDILSPDAFLAKVDPGMKTMDPKRQPVGTQDEWATKEDNYRFGWNACRAEMLNNLERNIAALSRPTAADKIIQIARRAIMDAPGDSQCHTINELLAQFDAKVAAITPSEGPSKTKLPASPDAGGGPIPRPTAGAHVSEDVLRKALTALFETGAVQSLSSTQATAVYNAAQALKGTEAPMSEALCEILDRPDYVDGGGNKFYHEISLRRAAALNGGG